MQRDVFSALHVSVISPFKQGNMSMGYVDAFRQVRALLQTSCIQQLPCLQCPTVYHCYDLEGCSLREANEVVLKLWYKSAFPALFLLLNPDFLPITFHLPKETVKTSRLEGVHHT